MKTQDAIVSDRPFRIFRAPQSLNRLVLCSSEQSIDELQSSKIVNESVGLYVVQERIS